MTIDDYFEVGREIGEKARLCVECQNVKPFGFCPVHAKEIENAIDAIVPERLRERVRARLSRGES